MGLCVWWGAAVGAPTRQKSPITSLRPGWAGPAQQEDRKPTTNSRNFPALRPPHRPGEPGPPLLPTESRTRLSTGGVDTEQKRLHRSEPLTGRTEWAPGGRRSTEGLKGHTLWAQGMVTRRGWRSPADGHPPPPSWLETRVLFTGPAPLGKVAGSSHPRA